MATLSSAGNSIVDDYISTYRPLEVLQPSVAKICETPELERMFWDCLTYDLNVINRRSPNLADFEITAAQKAFSALSRNETDSVAAIELYMEEILGLKYVEDSDRAQTLTAIIHMRNYLLNAETRYRNSAAPEISGSELSASPRNEFGICEISRKRTASTDISPVTEGLFHSDGSDGSQVLSSPCGPFGLVHSGSIVGGSGDETVKPNEEDPRLNRLLSMFYQANHDFRIAPLKSPDHTKAAKFLRDTIENTLSYITTKQLAVSGKKLITGFDNSTLDYLHETLKQARTVADEGSGKKRRFEEPPVIKSQPSAQNIRPTNPLLRGRTKESKVPQPDMYRPKVLKGPVTKLTTSNNYRPSAQLDPLIPTPQQYRNFQARKNQTMQKRAVSPFHRYPATIGQSVRRVFPRIEKPFAVRQQLNVPRRGDRYRPLYK
ncbi:hypothetical protein N7G274_007366 [Stereocaulon virgatum]|uniref:Uncharacterized protein n=1 Tax=Stereocaulon virgatum TaxID=373712 RepID=A0ABR4A4G4_9LECA